MREKTEGELPTAAGPPGDRGEAVRRLLKHLHRRTIAELQDGSAAVVVGIVRSIPGVPLVRGPLSGRECLGYHVDIRGVTPDALWRLPQLYEQARCVDLEVEDGTGVVRVIAEGLELAITDGPAFRYEPTQVPPHVRTLVPGYPWAITLEEGVLVAGAPILVCGLASRARDATSYRDGETHLVLSASPTFPLVASSDEDLFKPGDRTIDPEELRRR